MSSQSFTGRGLPVRGSPVTSRESWSKDKGSQSLSSDSCVDATLEEKTKDQSSVKELKTYNALVCKGRVKAHDVVLERGF